MPNLIWKGLASLAISALVSVGSAWATENTAAKAFGARPGVEQASLSPDGMWIALVQPLQDGQASALFVAPLDGTGQPKAILSATGRPERLRDCGWVSNTRLVCSIYILALRDGFRLGHTRMIAVNADGTKAQELSARSSGVVLGYQQDGGEIIDGLANDASGSVLMTRVYTPEASTGTLLANQRKGLGVERVDTNTLRRSLVEPPHEDAVHYISDQFGSVRILGQQLKTNTGYNRAQINYVYRPADGGPWTPLGMMDWDAHSGFRPVAVDRDLNVAYGFEWLNGRQAVTRVSLDGSMKREVLLSRDDVDVDRLIRIGRQNRVVGASFATDKRQSVFFDPTLKALTTSLSKALPGHPVINFVDASQDESRLLLWAGSDIDPGRYYLYDKTTRRLSEIMPQRPELASVKLATVQAMTYKADDGTMVPAYLTLPPGSDGKSLPAIVMPHGGPAARDEWGFDWLAQYFANQGFAVLQPNFRGSSGYGEAWFEQNGFQSWRKAIGDVNDAGRWLRDQGIAAPGKLAIVGWSYGGYAALQSSVLDPELFKAIVAVAPVTDLETLREESRNFTNFKIMDAYIGRGPHLREGSPAQNAEKIKAPILMFHGDQDVNVGVGESRLMLSRLKSADKKAELVIFPGLDHQLDDSAARAQMLDKAEVFLRASLGL
ncbi:alpha/beta hydrolase family protein [Caulobacter sp.]|uniref:alpha/beta hydrolase family protein n=1 Tax=Caulobacter sp. TaxID=78 RepID=UPI003BAC018A